MLCPHHAADSRLSDFLTFLTFLTFPTFLTP